MCISCFHCVYLFCSSCVLFTCFIIVSFSVVLLCTEKIKKIHLHCILVFSVFVFTIQVCLHFVLSLQTAFVLIHIFYHPGFTTFLNFIHSLLFAYIHWSSQSATTSITIVNLHLLRLTSPKPHPFKHCLQTPPRLPCSTSHNNFLRFYQLSS